jgi:hypothetical protein
MLRFHKILFLLAGIYNLAFGIWLFCSPQSLFAFAGLPILIPIVFYRILAVIIAGFSVIYFYSILRPEKAKYLILLGLLSKIAPTIFVIFMQIFSDFSFDWYKMLFFNDMIWWIPFCHYLAGQNFKK